MIDRVGHSLGNYQLLRLLGRGAFAEVYLAEHHYLEVPAAIKVLHVQMEPETHEQFRREARTIAHLQHPHILHVLEFGTQDQIPYLVMEYAPNGTLRSAHPKGLHLSLEQIVTYVKQIASALDYAHQQRVIHRDVKPENLLLNARHEVVLSDFGIAVVQQTLNSRSTHNHAGTPLYMAPEQLQHQPCAASDEYALGVLVYEWLCGEPPFCGTLFEVLSQHLYHQPPSLRSRRPDLPVAAEDAILKALAKDPRQRFASIEEFSALLEEACLATRPLALHDFPEKKVFPFVPTLTERDLASASSSMQPLLKTAFHREREQELVPSLSSLPATPGPAVTQDARLSLAHSNRQRFLRRVRTFWIEGVLEHSLHGATLIAMGLQQQLDALANPWQFVLQHPDTAPCSFPPGTLISSVYDVANGELLILGAPGSGKTTLLLTLARDLLERAVHDERHLMPVVFPLSSWATKQQPLSSWMVEELISKYQVSRKLARAWVDADQILPLLDGLDEVATGNRTACIEAINTNHQEHSFLPFVVCSRKADYLAQTARVRLMSAVTIQSLTQQQVDDYLVHGGEALWALRVALHRDASLRELTDTPLMLSILTLTYRDLSVEELLRGGIAPTRQQIFEHYIERMLAHRSGKISYRPEQTRKWLAWLAKQLVQHRQTVFYIERMQPDWLPAGRLRHIYHSSILALIAPIILLMSWTERDIKLKEVFTWSRIRIRSNLLESLASGSIYGLLIVLGLWVTHGFSFEVIDELIHHIQGGFIGELLLCVTYVLLCGLCIWLTSSGIYWKEREIRPAEVLTWSWGGLRGHIGRAIGGGVITAVIAGGISGFIRGLIFGRITGLLLGVIVGCITGLDVTLGVALLHGWSATKLDDTILLKPNQGIWYSARNMLLTGAIFGFGTATILWFTHILSMGISSELDFALMGASPKAVLSTEIIFLLVGAWIGGLLNGGIACIQHVILRMLLWLRGCLPWNYPRFLDYASERILLRKVGGGYIFVHRLLLEHFASLE